jgi:hypothetical protein
MPQPNRKFTDDQLIQLHRKDLTDQDIADTLQVSNGTVARRRYKLKLMPKYPKAKSNPILSRQKDLQGSNQYRSDHRDKVNPSYQRYRETHREQFHQYCLKYDQAHREERRQYAHKWREENPEKRRQIANTYYRKTHPNAAPYKPRKR